MRPAHVHPLAFGLRIYWRLLPGPLREKEAVRLFLKMMPHPEPEREQNWRRQGRESMLAGCAAVAYESNDAGKAADAPTVLLTHGWQGRGLQLGSFIAPLRAAGYRVIAVDLPGHGRNAGNSSSVPEIVQYLEHVMAEEPNLHAVIAHSFSGAGAILAADRTGWGGPIACLGGPPEALRAFDRFYDMVGFPQSARPGFRRRIEGMFQVNVDNFLVADAARRRTAATLAVLAENDSDVPNDESRELVELAKGDVHVLPDCGHRDVMWDQRAIDHVMDFLVKNAPQLARA